MTKSKRYSTRNSEIVFREEAHNWAILFDPNSGKTYGLDPTSMFVWKKLDGNHSLEEIVAKLKEICRNSLPDCAMKDVTNFINDLIDKKFAHEK